jgi:mono/diheme cytochrome c family protein
VRSSLSLAVSLAVTLCGCVVAGARADEHAPADRVSFARDVRPILAASCFACHGPDANERQAGLRLDTAEGALAALDSGDHAIVPGDTEASGVVFRITTDEATLKMPPPGRGKPLTPDQVATITTWIEQGAAYDAHWSFIAPIRPEPPAVADARWSRNPIDRFIKDRLDREGLAPSSKADRATLIRRASLDLTGLPPSPGEVAAFLADPADDAKAYEQVIDSLLASPHYGERWARWWLDRARYADTNGYEKDRERSIWPYRDWVIRAFNQDMPFDRFTIAQLAGDLLPGATLDDRVATGFHRNTMTNEEGGIDVEEFRFASVVDRVGTTGSVWLGLTVACAQCHTHKYDPIDHDEYYRLFALFNNADEPEAALPDPAIDIRRGMALRRVDAMIRELADRFPPAEPALFPGEPEADRRRRNLESKRDAWLADVRAKAAPWGTPAPSRLLSRKHATLTVQDDLSVLATGDTPNNDVTEIDLPLDRPGVTAIRLEVLPDPSLPDGGPGRAPLFSVGDFILTEVEAAVALPDGSSRKLTIIDASESHAEPNKPARLAIDGVPDSGWSIRGGTGRAQAAVFAFDSPIDAPPGSTLKLTLHQFGIHQLTLGRFRVSVTDRPGPVRATGLTDELEKLALRPASELSVEDIHRLTSAFLSSSPDLAEPRKEFEAARAAVPRPITTLVMRERDRAHRRVTHIHRRGEFLQPGDPVEPGVPAVLPPLPDDAPRDRLAFARWLVSGSNPLTGRVLVNQLWQAHFGRGLVETTEDFGTRGAPPSHPELLDWLACELVARGWGLKAMHRLIVTSETYKQSSVATSEMLTRDPRNVLLARAPRLRLEAEAVRDLALAASGLLERKIGGPSVYPPQPDGVVALAYGQNTWPTATGPDRYRRGLYTFTKRTAPYAAFATFDAPSSETTCVRRERSNTPLQALVLLNDTVFVEASRALARRVLKESYEDSSNDRARLDRAFLLLMARQARDDEAAPSLEFLDQQRDRFRTDPDAARALMGPLRPDEDAAEAAAWTALARVLLNLDETITRE